MAFARYGAGGQDFLSQFVPDLVKTWATACMESITTKVQTDLQLPGQARYFAYEAKRRTGSADVLLVGNFPSSDGTSGGLMLWMRPPQGDIASFTMTSPSKDDLPNATIQCGPPATYLSYRMPRNPPVLPTRL